MNCDLENEIIKSNHFWRTRSLKKSVEIKPNRIIKIKVGSSIKYWKKSPKEIEEMK